MSPVDPLLQGLVTGFVTEAQELCEKATKALLELEKGNRAGGSNSKAVDELARSLHTLKGSASTLGLEEIALLAHTMEDLILREKVGSQPLKPDTTNELLRGLDVVLTQVTLRGNGSPPEEAEIKAAIARLEGASAVDASTEVEFAPPAAALDLPPEVEREEKRSWRVSSDVVLSMMGEVERLRELRLRIEQRYADVHNSLREFSGRGTRPAALSHTDLPLRLLDFKNDGEELGSMVDALEEHLKAICTLPLRQMTDPLHRLVRDSCLASGKEAELSVVGGQMSLDRRLLEALKGPLTHLMHNALDHGVESPDDRIAAGKHRAATVVIRAEQQGNRLFLEVSDDGRGIDLARVQAIAFQRGLATEEELAAMSPAQVQQFIMRPGFSTAVRTTQTSGRGIGLDVVRAEVQDLEGTLEVASKAGQGARFLLSIPTEIGGSAVLVVRCGEHSFGIPIASVSRTLLARPELLHLGRGTLRLDLPDGSMPLFDLGALMDVRQMKVPSNGQPLLVLQCRGDRFGLAVDSVVGHRDLAIRPMPEELRNLQIYQGAAMLADGAPLLVLRTDALFETSERRPATLTGGRRALVVDDSVAARAMHRAILESGGFTVHAVSGARQALDHLRTSAYDVVVSDVSMDEMDGFALTRTLRGRPETQRVPILLVSASDRPADRERGFAVGASAFLTKRECGAGRLLAEVLALIDKHPGGTLLGGENP